MERIADLNGWTLDEVEQYYQDRIKELEAEQKRDFTYCAYCGERFACDGEHATTAVSNHIATCPKHPMRDVEARVKELESLLKRLEWSGNSDCCPVCHNYAPDSLKNKSRLGHRADCDLAKALPLGEGKD
jgi:hypothetical protein